MTRDLKLKFFPETRFGGFTRVDGTIAFYQRVNAFIDSRTTVLDVGCGIGDYKDDPVFVRKSLRILRGRAKKVIGIDVDPRAAQNLFLDDFVQITGQSWLVPDSSIDLCLCDYVLEHVEDVDRFLVEVKRVLKTGGVFCLRTPNILGYAALFSRVIPNDWHERILRRVQNGRGEGEAYRTFYRCNTPKAVRKLLSRFDFDSTVFCHEPEPSYLDFSPVAYFTGVLYGAVAPSFMRNVIFAFGIKR